MTSTYDDDGGLYPDEDGGSLDAPRGRLVGLDGSGDPEPLDLALCTLPENDLANADRLMRRNEGRLYWTKEWGPGVYDGRRFDFDRGEAMAGQLAQAAARRMLSHEAMAFYETQRRPTESVDDWEKRAGRFYGWCLQAGNNSRTEAMLKQAERMLTRPLGEFDADPDRLVVANGTLMLPRDGSDVRFTPEHRPGDLVSRVAGAKYDPAAKAPEFEKFLAKVQPDPEDRAFLARVVGYSLTGHIGEQAYFIFQGKGGDGKSTFLTALEAALGNYVANAAIETFLKHDKKGSDHSADIARLASGVRLVKASEPEQGARLAESVLKVVTGGEPFPARAMYRPPFEFVARWKLIISCNRKPQIRGDDRGIWRRTLVLPWPVSIPKEEMDKALGDRLAAEGSGILNWALMGWADWLERGGLDPTPNVLAAVEEYRLNSNPFGAWFDTCCTLAEGVEARSEHLFGSYKGWVGEVGFEPMSRTAFGRSLSERNLDRKRSNGIAWVGVKLNDAGEAALRQARDAEDEARFGGGRGGRRSGPDAEE